jgi:hypothetical protein
LHVLVYMCGTQFGTRQIRLGPSGRINHKVQICVIQTLYITPIASNHIDNIKIADFYSNQCTVAGN